jgi:hypothetical protein
MFTGLQFITTRRIAYRKSAEQLGRYAATPWQRAFAAGFLIAASPFKASRPSLFCFWAISPIKGHSDIKGLFKSPIFGQ